MLVGEIGPEVLPSRSNLVKKYAIEERGLATGISIRDNDR